MERKSLKTYSQTGSISTKRNGLMKNNGDIKRIMTSKCDTKSHNQATKQTKSPKYRVEAHIAVDSTPSGETAIFMPLHTGEK